MTIDNSPPHVRQRTEESVADRLHRMRSRQFLSERRSERSSSAPHRLDANREPLGVLVQLCLPGLSHTGTGVLWQHDHHPRG
jgi:hypothetical protein